MQLFLHIGVHKTGSSAIQAALARNRMALRERDIWYEPPAGHDNHTALALGFGNGTAGVAEHFNALLDQAQASGCSKCIFSSEQFCGPLESFHDLAACVGRFDATVIAYIRRGDEIMVSTFNELVRDASTRWTAALADKPPYNADYSPQLKRWLGDKPWRLLIAPYDPPQWRGGNIVADFLSMVGVDHDGLDMGGVVNRSLPPALIEILRLANATGMDGAGRADFVAALFDAWDRHPDMYGHGSLLTDEQCTAYRTKLFDRLPVYEPYLRPGFDRSFFAVDSPTQPRLTPSRLA